MALAVPAAGVRCSARFSDQLGKERTTGAAHLLTIVGLLVMLTLVAASQSPSWDSQCSSSGSSTRS